MWYGCFNHAKCADRPVGTIAFVFNNVEIEHKRFSFISHEVCGLRPIETIAFGFHQSQAEYDS